MKHRKSKPKAEASTTDLKQIQRIVEDSNKTLKRMLEECKAFRKALNAARKFLKKTHKRASKK